jgi:SAM-dependent methyltransferase
MVTTGPRPDSDTPWISPATDKDGEPPADALPGRRRRVHEVINPSVGRGLEIGPLCSPLVTKDEGDVFYVDVLPTEGLRAHYAADPTVDGALIVDVDVPLLVDGRLRSIEEATGEVAPFDWAVASHVIEHVPDMIGWLADVADVLVDDGRLLLVIPDRRYSFDALRARTTVGQLLQAHEARDQRPSIRAVYDHFSDAVSISSHEAWTGRVPTIDARVHDRAYLAGVLRRYGETPDYIDCHVWLFTPQEFVQQLAELAERGLLDFVVETVVPTAPFDLEYFVTLRRIPRATTDDDRAALFDGGFVCPDDVPAASPPGVTMRALSEREASLLDAKRRLLEGARARLARWRGRRATSSTPPPVT